MARNCGSGRGSCGMKHGLFNPFFNGNYANEWDYTGGGGVQATAPSPLIANSLDTTTANVSWNDTGADNYILQRATQSDYSDASQVYSGALLTFADSGLTMGAMYYYRVKAQVTGVADSEWVTDSVQTISFMPLAWYEFTGIERGVDNDYGNTGALTYQIETAKSIINTSGPLVTFTNLPAVSQNNANFGYNCLNPTSISYGDLASDISLTGDFTICMPWWVKSIPVNAQAFVDKNTANRYIRFSDLNTLFIFAATQTTLDFPSDLVVGHKANTVIQRASGIIRISLDGGTTLATAGVANNATITINRLFASLTPGSYFNQYIERLVITDSALTSGQLDQVFNYLKRPDYTPAAANAPTEMVLPEGVTWSEMPTDNTIVDTNIEDAATGSLLRERVLVKGKYAAILYHDKEEIFMQDHLLVWDTEANQYCVPYSFPILLDTDTDVHNSGDIFDYDSRWNHAEQLHYSGHAANPLNIRRSNQGYNLSEFNLVANAKGVAKHFADLNNYHQFNQLGDALLMYTQNWASGYAEWIAAWKSTDGMNYFEKNRIASTGAGSGKWFYFYAPNNGSNNFSVLFLNFLDNNISDWEYPYCFALKTTDGHTFTNLAGSFSRDVRDGNTITLAELTSNCVFTQAASAGNSAYVPVAVMDSTGETSGIGSNGSNTGFDWFFIDSDGTTTKHAMDFGGRNVRVTMDFLAEQSLVYWKVSDQERHAVLYEDNGDGLWQLAHYKTMDKGLTTEFVGIISNDNTKKFHRMVMNKSNPYDDYVVIAATIVESATQGSVWLKRIEK